MGEWSWKRGNCWRNKKSFLLSSAEALCQVHFELAAFCLDPQWDKMIKDIERASLIPSMHLKMLEKNGKYSFHFVVFITKSTIFFDNIKIKQTFYLGIYPTLSLSLLYLFFPTAL